MAKASKKPITKRGWFWPVVGLCAIGAIAGGPNEDDTKNADIKEPTAIVQNETLPQPEKEELTPEELETNKEEPREEPETSNENLLPSEEAQEEQSVEKQEKPEPKPTENLPEQDVEAEPETAPAPAPEPEPDPEPTSAPEPSETQEPTKNTNSNGKERRGSWASGDYMASSESDKYHDYECRGAKKILPGNEIWFHSEEEAQAAGYSRCGICW